MTSFRCDEEVSTIENDSDDVVQLKTEISKLSVENEKYRQELHELHRKLETGSNMQAELAESNEILEQSLKEHKAGLARRIHEIEEKHIGQKKLLQEKIEEMEAELLKKSKESQDLREIIKANEEKLLAMSQTETTVNAEESSVVLHCEIEKLTELLQQEAECRKNVEDAMEIVQRDSNELREILTATKGQLAEKNQVLESTREELSNYRLQLESLKTTPATDSGKGNSLFAEVEDRRKLNLQQMNAMRSSYLTAKRSFQAKEAEIKALRAERAMLLRKWEDDTVEKIQQDANLFDKYKMRISELENQLKNEKKKPKDVAKSQQGADNNFTFLQSLVETKKKEVEELLAKIENDSIKALLEEETKHKTGKQLRYWRYKAMSAEAQLCSIKNRLQSDPSSSNTEILAVVESCLKAKPGDSEGENSMAIEASYRETTIANQTVVTLEKLMEIPSPFTADEIDSTSSNDKEMEETLCVIGSCKAGGPSSIKQEPIADASPTVKETIEKGKSVSSMKTERQEPNNENEHPSKKTDGNVYVAPILKSVLANSQQNFSAKVSIKETTEKDKKTLRFTEDTVDPPSNPLKKQPSKPQYPIIFISSNKPKV